MERKSIMEDDSDGEQILQIKSPIGHSVGFARAGCRDSIDSIISQYAYVRHEVPKDIRIGLALNAEPDYLSRTTTSMSIPGESRVSTTERDADAETSVATIQYANVQQNQAPGPDHQLLGSPEFLQELRPGICTEESNFNTGESTSVSSASESHSEDTTGINWKELKDTLLDVYAKFEGDPSHDEIKTTAGDEWSEAAGTDVHDQDLPYISWSAHEVVNTTLPMNNEYLTNMRQPATISNDDHVTEEEEEKAISSTLATPETQLNYTPAVSDKTKTRSYSTATTAVHDADFSVRSQQNPEILQELTGTSVARNIAYSTDEHSLATNDTLNSYNQLSVTFATKGGTKLDAPDAMQQLLGGERAFPEPQKVATVALVCQWFQCDDATDCILNLGIILMLCTVALAGHVFG